MKLFGAKPRIEICGGFFKCHTKKKKIYIAKKKSTYGSFFFSLPLDRERERERKVSVFSFYFILLSSSLTHTSEF